MTIKQIIQAKGQLQAIEFHMATVQDQKNQAIARKGKGNK